MTKRPSLAINVKPSKLSESMKSVAEDTAPNLMALSENAQAIPRTGETKSPVKRYQGMKKMLIPIDPDVHRNLKMLAVQRDTTLEKIVQDAVEKYVESNRRS